MNANLAMLHQAILAAMHKFDRIFHRDDMVVPLQVRVIHHRSERGGLAGTGRAGDEDETFLQEREFFQDWRKAQILDRQHLRRDQTEDGRNAVFLLEKVGAITRHVQGLRNRSRHREFLRNV